MTLPLHAGYPPGCSGRITQLHARFYAAPSGFGVEFEAKVATELASFCTRLTPQRDGLWLAVQNGEMQGCIAIDGVKGDTEGAHLRWFIVADPLRGSGAGQRLLHAALQLCTERDCSRGYRWTCDQRHAAGPLYAHHGFTLAKTQRGRQWRTEVNAPLFVRATAEPMNP